MQARNSLSALPDCHTHSAQRSRQAQIYGLQTVRRMTNPSQASGLQYWKSGAKTRRSAGAELGEEEVVMCE